MKKSPKISLIIEAFHNLEKAYVDLKKNLEIPKEEFVKNKLVQDRVRIDFNLAFESSMRVCRHLSTVYGVKTSSKDCLYKLAKFMELPFAEELKKFSEFYFRYRDMKESVSPEELYDFLKNNLILFKEYARGVIEYIKKTTGNFLLIDFDLLNEKAKFVKDSVKKIDFVLSQGIEEFKKTPMYYDRVKYFYQVAYDSLFDICKHLAPKFGIKKFGDDCLTKMVEKGIIPDSYYDTVFKMMLLKNKLISTWEVSPEELYNSLKELNDKFIPVLREISNSLKELLQEKAKAGGT
ncbi:HepT-like ribonuclease domain-containing protein [Aquifex sp.]